MYYASYSGAWQFGQFSFRPHPEPLHSSHQENMHIAGARCATIQIQSKIRELMHEISTVDLVSGVMNIINYKDGAC